MALFDYSGQLQSGSLFEGTLEAATLDAARETLARLGVRVSQLRPAQVAAYATPLSLDDFLFFNEQLAALSKAGVPLENGLRQLVADVGSRKLKRLLLTLANDLESGTPLEQALERQKAHLPPYYASTVQAGLQSGDLGSALYGLAAHLQLKSNTRRALVELAAYPLVILTVALGVMSFVMRQVIPALGAMLMDLRETVVVPGGATSDSNFVFQVAHAWPTIEAIAANVLVAAVVFGLLLSSPLSRGLRERVLRGIPGIARIYWYSVLARFTHTGALAAHAGVPLPQLVQTSAAATGSPALLKAAREVSEQLEQGMSIEQAAAGQTQIPALWTCLVATTAVRGDLAAGLSELARTYEQRARQWVSTMRLILGPLLLVVVGGALALLILLTALAFLSLLRVVEGLTG